jgi:hypothetical protein
MKVQKLSNVTIDQFALAKKYYQILSVLNDLRLAEGQLQLVAFTAIKGNISDPENRDLYCKMYSTTPATINNVVDKMKKKKVFLKDGKKIYVNPALTQVKFNEPLALVIQLTIQKPIPKKPTKARKKAKAKPKKNDSILNVQKHG